MLARAYPAKEKQILDAFRAHDLGLYYASIPTILAFTDGIGRQRFPKNSIFSTRELRPNVRVPKTYDIVDDACQQTHLDSEILYPLKNKGKVNEPCWKTSGEDVEIFNRHLIMHGLSDNYGTEINSLKSISLAYFVHEALYYVEEAKSVSLENEIVRDLPGK